MEPFLDPSHAAVGGAGPGDGGDTVYLCAADEHGNLVSLIQSVAFDFGSGIVAESTGMLLQNRGCYFSLDPDHVNRLEPRKRTMHTLIPAMAVRDGKPWARSRRTASHPGPGRRRAYVDRAGLPPRGRAGSR